MTARIYRCPLCPWTREQPQSDEPAQAASVAAALGVPALAFSLIREQQAMQRLEQELRRHLVNEHTVEEWATEVRRLRDLLERAGVTA